MSFFSRCLCCKTRGEMIDRYRKQRSPRSRYSETLLPGNIEKSHFVYSPKLSVREDYIFRPSIQQLAQTFAVENLKIDKPTGFPLSSCSIDISHISLEQHPESPRIISSPDACAESPGQGNESLVPPLESPEHGFTGPELRMGSLELRMGSLELSNRSQELRTGIIVSPQPTNIKVIHVKAALDLWKNDEWSGLKEDGNDESCLEILAPSEVNVGRKEITLIKAKPEKECNNLVKETTAEPDSPLKTDSSGVVVNCLKDEKEQPIEPISKFETSAIFERDDNRSLTDKHQDMSLLRNLGRRNCIDNRNNNVDISTVALPESSFTSQTKPRPATLFCVTRDKAWRQKSSSENKEKKTRKGKANYTKVETFVEAMDDEIKRKKYKNIFKRSNKKQCIPRSKEIGATMLNMSDLSSTGYYPHLSEL